MNYLSIDTEYTSSYSTDRSKSGELLQVSIIPVIDGVPDMENAFNEFCKPLTSVWNPHAEKVHKIQRAKSQTFQHPEDLAQKLKIWLDKYDYIFTCMGFNCLGDKRFIERLAYDYKINQSWSFKVKPEWVDVYSIAKSKKKMIPKKSLKLESLCEYFGIKINAHDALSDARGTYLVYESLKQLKSEDEYRQERLTSSMSNVEKIRKYRDIKYMAINGDGDVYITKFATQSKEALRYVLDEIWNLYGE